MNKIQRLISLHLPLFLLSVSIFFIIFCGLYFIQLDLNLAYFDANTRLNTARRLFDNLTPGFAQIGSVWQPFPQVLFLPFVTSDYLWRTGIAGWLVSGISTIVASIFIFNTLKLITKSNLIGFIGGVSYLLNINILYLQSTAMSEPFFLMCITGMTYFTAKYLKTFSIGSLLLTAGFVFLGSLTRYEGFALVLGSTLLILSYTVFKSRSKERVESTFILYALPASMGIVLWSVYLWAIFGDPLYWLHYYADVQPNSLSPLQVSRPNPVQAFSSYLTSVIHMGGLITFITALIGVIYAFISKDLRKYTLLLVLPLFITIFMIATLTRNTVIIQPPINFETVLDKSYAIMKEFNIRYGLSVFPFLIIFSGLILKRSKFLVLPFVLLIAVQTTAYFYTPLNLTYQIRQNVGYGISDETLWIREHYDSGLILISALQHDPDMMQFNLPYKTYIHEGTQHFWKDSLKNPHKYATWIVMEKYEKRDPVTRELGEKIKLNKRYKLVYDKNNILIYKIIDKTDVQVLK